MNQRIHAALSQLHRRLFSKQTPDPHNDDNSQVIRVLFVCKANVCRSPIANAVAKRLAEERSLSRSFEFHSAGTLGGLSGAAADPRASTIAARRGYSLADHRARKVALSDFAHFDFLLAMDNDNLASLNKICPPEYAHKTSLFLDALNDSSRTDVPDPYFGSLEGFERVFDLCEAGIDAFLRVHRPFVMKDIEP
jgi:protein-tyrosine phosphatase